MAPCPGFSLLEIVVAIGILALTLVTLLGLTGSTMRSAGAAADVAVAARFGANLRHELERLKADLGLSGLAAVVPPGGSTSALELVATRDGGRMLHTDGAEPAADRALNDPVLPGIALRERYFLAEVTQQLDLPYASEAGFLALSVRVSWPYRLPVGPATANATAVNADPSREVPRSERNVAVFNIVLRP
jgi:hypothetical protein